MGLFVWLYGALRRKRMLGRDSCRVRLLISRALEHSIANIASFPMAIFEVSTLTVSDGPPNHSMALAQKVIGGVLLV